MRKVNYHTHTYRCGHAKGTEEEMIKAAISAELEEIGICCHIPLPHIRKHLLKALHRVEDLRSLASLVFTYISGGPTMRMPYRQINKHLKLIEKCEEKYKEKIQVYKGFEAEGIKEYFGYYQELLNTNKIDYLILGHHFHKYCIHSDYYGKKNLTKEEIYQYCKDIEDSLETGLFSYLAHPDLFLMGYHDFGEDMQNVSRRICKKAKELNIPLELNAGGIRKGLKNIQGENMYLYPNPYFWKIASEVGNDVILGLDAHHPKDITDEMFVKLKDFSENYNLNVVDCFKFLKGKIK